LERLKLVDVQDTTDNEDVNCQKCGLSYLADVRNMWVECERCGKWYDFKIKRCILDSYFCEDCK